MPDDDAVIARLDTELSRPWLTNLRTGSLIRAARERVSEYEQVRIADASGIVGELLDLLAATTDRLEATTREMHARELHHFESEKRMVEAGLDPDTGVRNPPIPETGDDRG